MAAASDRQRTRRSAGQFLPHLFVRLGVLPYYLHHPDAVGGASHFRVPIEEGLRIHAALAKRVSGVALPRYVIDPPDGSGKIDVRSVVDATGAVS